MTDTAINLAPMVKKRLDIERRYEFVIVPINKQGGPGVMELGSGCRIHSVTPIPQSSIVGKPVEVLVVIEIDVAMANRAGATAH